MVFIKNVSEIKKAVGAVHPTESICTYKFFDKHGKRYLQLDTYGSEDRQKSGIQSQTIQLDIKVAKQIKKILEEGFQI